MKTNDNIELGQTPRILVVDDEPSVGATIELALVELGGYSVVTVGSALEGMQRFASNPFDLVVTDFSMEGMDGRQFATAIKKRWPKTPVLLVSAYLEKAVATESLGTIFDGWLQKPFDLRALIGAVARLLGVPVRPAVAPGASEPEI
jgi:CheY-like chemotaxis protein